MFSDKMVRARVCAGAVEASCSNPHPLLLFQPKELLKFALEVFVQLSHIRRIASHLAHHPRLHLLLHALGPPRFRLQRTYSPTHLNSSITTLTRLQRLLLFGSFIRAGPWSDPGNLLT